MQGVGIKNLYEEDHFHFRFHLQMGFRSLSAAGLAGVRRLPRRQVLPRLFRCQFAAVANCRS